MRFPDIVYRTSGGQERSIADSKGKIALVYFWASWCPICAADLTNIQFYYNRFKDNPRFAAIILNFLDPYVKGVKWAEGRGYKLPFADSGIAGRSPIAVTRQGTYALPKWTPLFYLLDGNGVVLEASAAKQNTGHEIPETIEKYTSMLHGA